MSSPGQRRGGCGHVMANFDQHSYCARCREKNKGKDPCVENKDTTTCKFCLALTPEQLAQISTPSYKLKKEKREARKSETATPTKETSELVDPASVSVIGVVGQQETSKSSPTQHVPPEKKAKKEKLPSKAKKSSDSKIADLDSKWSEQFNRLEALLLSKTLQPAFSSEVKVTPPRSPPANIPRDSEPFFQPTGRTGKDFSAEMHQSACQLESDSQSTTTERKGKGFSAEMHQPASQLRSDRQQPSSSTNKRTGKGSSASLHQPASQLVTDRLTSRSPHRRTGKDTPALKQQSTSQPYIDRNRPPASKLSGTDPSSHRVKSTGKQQRSHVDRPASTAATDTGSPSLHRHRKDSA